MISAKAHAQNFEAVVADLEQAKLMYEYLRDGIDKTIQLLYFLQNEVIAPKQWFVVSHHAVVLFVNKAVYTGRASDIKLKAWVSKDGNYNFAELIQDERGKFLVYQDKNAVSFGDRVRAKHYLETFLNRHSFEL